MNIPTDPEYKEIIKALKPFLDVKGQRAADDVLGTMNLMKIIESLKSAFAESSVLGSSTNPTDVLALLANLDINEDVIKSIVSAISNQKGSVSPPKREGNGPELFNQFLSNLKTQDPKEAVGTLLSSLKESGVDVQPLQNLAKSLSNQAVGDGRGAGDDSEAGDAAEAVGGEEAGEIYWEREGRERDNRERDNKDGRERRDGREGKEGREGKGRRRSREEKENRENRED